MCIIIYLLPTQPLYVKNDFIKFQFEKKKFMIVVAATVVNWVMREIGCG